MKKYTQLSLGFITLMFLGIGYAWSLFVSPLESEFGWSRDETSMVFSIFIICFCIGSISGGIMTKQLSHRFTILSAALLLFSGFAVCSFINTLWQIYLFYGMFCGLGIGISYNTIITTVNCWFENNIGFSSGVMMMGYGFGSFIFGSIITFLNNNIGWRNTFSLFAVLFGLLLITTAFLLKQASGNSSDSSEKTPVRREFSPSQMFSTKPFYAYYFWAVCLVTSGLTIIGHASMIASYINTSLDFIILSVGCLTVSNGISRIIFGTLYDKYGRHITMLTITCVMGLGTILLELALSFELTPVLFISYCMIGMGYGGVSPCHTSFVKEYYGTAYMSVNFSIIGSNGIISSLAGPYILGVLISIFGSYTKSLPFLFIFTIIAFCLQHLLTSYSRRQ